MPLILEVYPMKHILFVCSQNRLRSPTAEQVFSGRPGIEVDSAGLNPDAVNPVCNELLEWADVIFVMEKSHKNKLLKKFRVHMHSQRVICLDIPDDYEFMDPKLIEVLQSKVNSYFTRMGV